MPLAYCDCHPLFGWLAVYSKRDPWFGRVFRNEPIIYFGA